jgi:hypothetical protein
VSERKSFPLSWPDGWKRTLANQRIRARFNTKEREYANAQPGQPQRSWLRIKDITVANAIERVVGELSMMGIGRDDLIISTNIPTRLDGLPRSDRANPSDPGAAVYWQRGKQAMRCMAIDLYDRVQDNLAAIAATLEAMRAIERHGGAEILNRAFLGFAALPEKASQPWRDVLGIHAQTIDLQIVEERFRALARVHHPDKGGDRLKFEEIVQAREAARLELVSQNLAAG